MAQFLKVETTDAPGFSLIPISEIGGMTAAANGADTELTITAKNGNNTYKVLIAGDATLADEMLLAFNKAIIANPGGVVSTVVPPLKTAQAPAAQSGEQGRILITQQAVYAQFKSVAFA
jgi:hypothetical protein